MASVTRINIKKLLPLSHSIVYGLMLLFSNFAYAKIFDADDNSLSAIVGTKTTVELTLEEKEYLASNELVVCNTNTTIGTTSSYKLLERLINDKPLNIKASQPLPQNRALQSLLEGRCDILPYAPISLKEHSQLKLTTPYARISRVIVTLKSAGLIQERIDSPNNTYAIARGDSAIPLFKNNYPNLQLYEVDNAEQGLRLVKTRQVDGLIDFVNIVNMLLISNGDEELNISRRLPKEFDEVLTVATLKDARILNGIIDKVITTVDKSEIYQFLVRQSYEHNRENENEIISLLSDEELDYLAKNVISVCSRAGYVGNQTSAQIIKFVAQGVPLNLLETEVVSWKDALDKIKRWECDILPDATQTPDRKNYMYFTPDYARMPYVVIANSDVEYFYNLSSHMDKAFAILKGNSLIAKLRKKYPEIRFVEVDYVAEGVKLVEEGGAFGMIGSVSAFPNILSEISFEGLKIVAQLESEFEDKVAFAISKDKYMLSQIMTKLVENTDKLAMHRWLLKYSDSQFGMLEFSQKEFDLMRGERFVICQISGIEPLTKTMIDYLLVKSGMRINYSQSYSWSRALVALENFECDILPWASPLPSRKKTMNFTNSYYEEEMVVFTDENQMILTDLAAYTDESFGVQKNDIIHGKLKNEYPGIKLREFERTIDAFSALQTNKVFAVVLPISQATEDIRVYGLKGIKVSGVLPEKFRNVITFATRKSDKELHFLLDKMLKISDRSAIDRIMLSRHSIKFDKGFDYRLFWQVVFAFSLLVALFIFWNRRLADVNKKLLEARTVADDAKRKTKGMLNSFTDGLLLFGRDLLVESEYSKQCLVFFDKEDIEGNRIDKLLFEKTGKDHDTFVKGIDYIYATADVNQKKIYRNLLPDRACVNDLVLSLQYKLFNNKVVLIATNITQQELLSKQLDKEQKIQKKLVYSLNNKNEVNQVILEFEAILRKAKHDFRGSANLIGCDKIKGFYRRIHTFKGLFLQIYFERTAYQLHKMEEELDHLSELNTSAYQGIIKLVDYLRFDKVQEVLSKEKNELVEKLGNDFLYSHRQFIVNEEMLTQLIDSAGDKNKIVDLLISLKKIDVLLWLSGHAESAQRQAARMKKRIDVIEIVGDRIFLDESIYNSFFCSLIHIFRNIVAHGIETIEERLERDKPSGGRIECHIGQQEGEIIIDISDDGNGIDIEKLRSNACAPNCDENCLSDEQLLLELFRTGFSQDKMASIDSGRGVGLSEIYYQLNKIDGRVSIQTEKGKGTTFTFKIPIIER